MHIKTTEVLIKTMSLVAVASSLMTLGVPMALAQEVVPTGTINDIAGFRTLATTAMNWVFTFFLIVAVIFLIVGGFQYLTAGGDPEKQTGARSRIIYSLIGVAVAVLALTLIRIIGSFLTGQSDISPV